MKYPKLIFYTENKDNLESSAICFWAKGITSRNYSKGNFLVLPKLIRKNRKTVHFPDFNFSKGFWRAINSNPNQNLNDLYPKPCIEEVSKLLSQENNKYKREKEKIISDWKKIESNFWKDVYKFLDFNKVTEKISEFEVILTPYGTRGSFYSPRKKEGLKPRITVRIDRNAGTIAESILHILYILKTNNGGEIAEQKFVKRMEVIRFLRENTIFKKYISKKPKETTLNKKLVDESNKYLKKLGFPNKTIDLSPVYKKLTKQEEKILKELEKTSGEIVSFDEVADILWGDKADEKYSLEAISKVIQNIRQKIRLSGINKNIIHTQRGKGYFLEN